MARIYLHADDFGLNEESSERILECCRNGYLDGISVLVNGCFEKAFPEAGVSVRLHLNLVEGPCVSDKRELPLLVDERGYFKYSFMGLLLLVYSPRRKQALEQIETELENQLLAFCRYTGSSDIMVDSHQHFHMITPIFYALLRVIDRNHLNVKVMRIPAEPLAPFLRHPSLYRTYRADNIMKNVLLNGCYLLIKKEVDRRHFQRDIFMGLMFSGKMKSQSILKVLPDFVRLADRKQKSLELLFHPGYILPQEGAPDSQKNDFLKFYYSENRKEEAAILKSESFYKRIKSYE